MLREEFGAKDTPKLAWTWSITPARQDFALIGTVLAGGPSAWKHSVAVLSEEASMYIIQT